MIANLGMYLHSGNIQQIQRFWGQIHTNLAEKGVNAPKELSQKDNNFELWLDPGLTLAQTCGMPYRLWLHDRVKLVGTIDYRAKDCPPGYYRSVFVARSEDSRERVTDFTTNIFAYNEIFSQSGYAAAYNHMIPCGLWFQNRLRTGSHIGSAKAVLDGTADIACLDCISWRLIDVVMPGSQKLKVIDWTDPTPGLPLITASDNDANTISFAVKKAISQMDNADLQAIGGVKDIVIIPKADYLKISNPPDAKTLKPF